MGVLNNVFKPTLVRRQSR